jgi:hypothetical protein
MQMTTDVRKALGEKTKLERDKALAKEEAARKALLEVSRALSVWPSAMQIQLIQGFLFVQAHLVVSLYVLKHLHNPETRFTLTVSICLWV